MVCFQQDCYVSFRAPGVTFQGRLKSDRSVFWYTVCSEQDYNPYFHASRILFLDHSIENRSVLCAIARSQKDVTFILPALSSSRTTFCADGERQPMGPQRLSKFSASLQNLLFLRCKPWQGCPRTIPQSVPIHSLNFLTTWPSSMLWFGV